MNANACGPSYSVLVVMCYNDSSVNQAAACRCQLGQHVGCATPSDGCLCSHCFLPQTTHTLVLLVFNTKAHTLCRV